MGAPISLSLVLLIMTALMIPAISEKTLEETLNERRQHVYRDCQDIFYQHKNRLSDGIYTIEPHGSPGSFDIFCELDSEGVVWTWIQHREDGSVDFYLDWLAYKYGFGWLNKEFWLGNEKIYYLTNQASYKIRFEMTDTNDNYGYADYRYFHIKDESNFYRIHMGDFLEGNAGDSMANPNYIQYNLFHGDKNFTTMDYDYDNYPGLNCALGAGGGGGWWYDACDVVNLNGAYCKSYTTNDHCVEWYSWPWKSNTEFKTTTMKIKSQSHFPI